MIFQELPTSGELDRRPQLAALAALDTAVEIAVAALAAAHPTLPFVEEDPSPPRHDVTVADAIVQQGTALQRLVGCYCRLTEPQPSPQRPTLVTPPRQDP